MKLRILGAGGVATSVGDVFAGDVVDLPGADARFLLVRGYAERVDDAPDEHAPDVTPPGVVDSRDPEVDNADPSQRKKR